MRFNELRETLQLRLSGEFKRFADEELRAVLTLLAGPGVVWELAFGSWLLLQPQRINAYAQAVIRTLQADEHQRGCLMEERVFQGNLAYESSMPLNHEIHETHERNTKENRRQRSNRAASPPGHHSGCRRIGQKPQFAPFFVCFVYFVVLSTWREPEQGTRAGGRGHRHRGARGPDQPGVQGCITLLYFSLSSIGWRRGLGIGGPFLLVSPLLSPLPARSSQGEDGELDAALPRVNVSDQGIDMEAAFEVRSPKSEIRKNSEIRNSTSCAVTRGRLALFCWAGRCACGVRISGFLRVSGIRSSEFSHWMAQAFPVLLLIRNSEGEVRWMEVRDWLRACFKIRRGPVFAEKAFWRGETSEHTHLRSVSEEQRSQKAFSAKTRRAAGLLGGAFVGSALTARCGDAPASPPRPRPKSLAAGPRPILKQALKRASDNGKKPVKQIVFEGERFDVMSVRRWRERVLGAKPSA